MPRGLYVKARDLPGAGHGICLALGSGDLMLQAGNGRRVQAGCSAAITAKRFYQLGWAAFTDRTKSCRHRDSGVDPPALLFPVSQISSQIRPRFWNQFWHEKRHNQPGSKGFLCDQRVGLVGPEGLIPPLKPLRFSTGWAQSVTSVKLV